MTNIKDHFLHKFFNPESVAVVGASNSPARINRHLVSNSVNHGFKGRIYPVNPKVSQVLGIAACFLWVFPTAFALFKLVDKTIGLRVSPEEELEGLDFVEHGGNAYPDFEVSSYGGMSTEGIPAGAAAAVSSGYAKASKRVEATS